MHAISFSSFILLCFSSQESALFAYRYYQLIFESKKRKIIGEERMVEPFTHGIRLLFWDLFLYKSLGVCSVILTFIKWKLHFRYRLTFFVKANILFKQYLEHYDGLIIKNLNTMLIFAYKKGTS